MDVSENSGFYPPNHPFLIGFSIINHPFWGTPIFGTLISYYILLFAVSHSYLFHCSPRHPTFTMTVVERWNDLHKKRVTQKIEPSLLKKPRRTGLLSRKHPENSFEKGKHSLVGGWTNPSAKWVHLPQIGVEIKHIWVATRFENSQIRIWLHHLPFSPTCRTFGRSGEPRFGRVPKHLLRVNPQSYTL